MSEEIINKICKKISNLTAFSFNAVKYVYLSNGDEAQTRSILEDSILYNIAVDDLINASPTPSESAMELLNEYCVWDKADSNGDNMFGCGKSYLTPINAVKRYKVCPYCTLEIKIKENK